MPEPTEPQADERPLLILVSSFGRTSREYFLASIATRYRLWLFLGGPGRPDEPTWELPYLAGHTSLNTLDAAAMTAAANRLNAQVRTEHAQGIAGIVSYDESRIVATAAVAEALNLPTSPPRAVERCRDKYLTRQALAAANVPQARAVAVRTPEQATAAANDIGYPVVLKPRHLAASFGVTRADSAEELEAAYHRAHARNKHQDKESAHRGYRKWCLFSARANISTKPRSVTSTPSGNARPSCGDMFVMVIHLDFLICVPGGNLEHR